MEKSAVAVRGRFIAAAGTDLARCHSLGVSNATAAESKQLDAASIGRWHANEHIRHGVQASSNRPGEQGPLRLPNDCAWRDRDTGFHAGGNTGQRERCEPP